MMLNSPKNPNKLNEIELELHIQIHITCGISVVYTLKLLQT